MAKNEAVKRVLTYCSWPMVFFLGLTGAYFAFSSEHPITTFLAVYAGAVASLFLLNVTFPTRRNGFSLMVKPSTISPTRC